MSSSTNGWAGCASGYGTGRSFTRQSTSSHACKPSAASPWTVLNNGGQSLKVDEVYDWAAFLAPLGVSMSGHGGPAAPHEFDFCTRSGYRKLTCNKKPGRLNTDLWKQGLGVIQEHNESLSFEPGRRIFVGDVGVSDESHGKNQPAPFGVKGSCIRAAPVPQPPPIDRMFKVRLRVRCSPRFAHHR